MNAQELSAKLTAFNSLQFIELRLCLLDHIPVDVYVPVDAPQPSLEASVQIVIAFCINLFAKSLDHSSNDSEGKSHNFRQMFGLFSVSFHHCKHCRKSGSISRPSRSNCARVHCFLSL